MTTTNPRQKFVYYWIATIFLILVVIIGLATATAAGMRAKITVSTAAPITAKTDSWQIKIDKELTVDPATLNFQPVSVEISATQDFTPLQGEEKDGFARGEFTLINNSGNPQTLVATTRLLTKDNVLFRIEKQVNIPAGGKITTIAKADKAGASGNIAPSSLTIPGLTLNLQEKIYAENAAAITGGIVKTGVISQDDLTTSTAALQSSLTAQAQEKISAAIAASKDTKINYQDFKLIPELIVSQIVSQSTSAEIGDKTDSYKTTLKMKFTALMPKITEVNVLTGRDASSTQDISSFDWQLTPTEDNNSAKVELTYQGQSAAQTDIPTIDTRQLTFKSEKQIRKYLEAQNLTVNDLNIEFKPGWLHLTPITAKNLTLEIK